MILGCRWSIIFDLCAATLVLVGVNSLVLVVGAWSFYARLFGNCCLSLIGCLNITAIVVTGCFRFNTMGKLTALSLSPSKFDEDAGLRNFYLTDTRTYADDGRLILWLWVA